MSNVEKVVSNDEQKLIFLKAIILGINYGKSNNSEQYRKNIEDEIYKLAKKINSEKIDLVNNSPQIPNHTQNQNQKIDTQTHTQTQSIKPVDKISRTIEKYENIIITLENQKNNTVSLINSLSSNNYGFNYSRINLLKSNLSLIYKEIEKNKIIISKLKESNGTPQVNQPPQQTKNTFAINNVNDQSIRNLDNNTQSTELLKPIQKHFIEKNMNENIIKKSVQFQKSSNNSNKPKENLVGELQKTLTGLTSLFSNSDSKKN